MRDLPAGLGGLAKSAFYEPIFVVRVSWDDDDSIYTYLTSTPDAALPASVDAIDDVVLSISGQTQMINPDIATSTVGSVNINLLDAHKVIFNDFLWSEDFTQSAWHRVFVIPTGGYVAPDGTATAQSLKDFSASIPGYARQDITISDDSGLYESILYLKQDTAAAPLVTLQLSGGTSTVSTGTNVVWAASPMISAGTIEDAGSGWWKLRLTLRNNSTGNTQMRLIVWPSGSIPSLTTATYVWGVHGGKYKRTNDYLKTTTAAATQTVPMLVTTKMNAQLDSGYGLRSKTVRVYVGYRGLPFTAYDLRLTYIVSDMQYNDGVYTVALADIQREVKQDIFTPHETNLYATISESALIIPVTSVDTAKFPLVAHGAEWSVRPNETMSYIKIEDEVIGISSSVQFDSTNGWHLVANERGALNTRAAEHTVDDGTVNSRKPKITEHIYLEGAAPKITYAILTGVLLNGSSPEDSLPTHWHLGIKTGFVRLSDFQTIGLDYWDPADDSGRKVRIENPGSQNGKRYIEKEILIWLGAFMPVYSTGELGIKRLNRVLSDGAYQFRLDRDNVVSYSALKHGMQKIINIISVNWNYVDSKGDFTKTSLLIDQGSISVHKKAAMQEYAFKAVNTGAHTDENLLAYFDTLRDRYAGPPLTMTVGALPSMHRAEVGDTCRVVLEQVRDFNTGSTLDRTFEVQQVATNWSSGNLSFSLFGSSQAAGTLDRTTLANVMAAAFYSSEGTPLDSSESPAGPLTIVAGVVTVSGSVTGSAGVKDNAAIYYYIGDLEIGAGVTVTISQNVQLRIMGTLTVNGAIDGIANGPTGGATTTQFVGGATNEAWVYDPYDGLTTPLPALDIDYGNDGWFGIVQSGAALKLAAYNQGQPPPYGAGTYVGILADPDGAVFNNLPLKGAISTIPWFDIVNPAGLSLSGIPDDLRGHGGPGGMPMITNDTAPGGGTSYIRGNGGAGGDGGAGLCVICRGIAFGGAGTINLSGSDAGNPTSYTIGATKTLWAGHGAPGSPGALLVLIDGDYTNPDIDGTKFIANMGAVGTAAGATEISLTDYNAQIVNPNQLAVNIVDWTYASAIFNIDSMGAIQDNEMWQSAYRIQYLPEAEIPITDDSSFPLYSSGKYNDILKMEWTAPAAGVEYGMAVAIVDDGSRFAVMYKDVGGTGNRTVEVIRSVTNPVREATIYPTTGLTPYSLAFSKDGSRLMIEAALDAVGVGAVYMYSRNGVTWSLEQKILSGSSADSLFGARPKADELFEHALIPGDIAAGGGEIQYWTRSGTTWTYQNSLAEPYIGHAFHTLYGESEMSGDGNYYVVGDSTDNYYGTNVGAAFVYSRSGTAWSLMAILGSEIDAAQEWGTDVAINKDGTAIVVGGLASANKVGVYIRVQSTITLLQIIEVGSGGGGVRFKMSNSGLVLTMTDVTSGDGHVYIRGSIEQPFKLRQSIPLTDYVTGQSLSPSAQYVLSSSSTYIAHGNPANQVVGYLAGAVRVYQFNPNAET